MGEKHSVELRDLVVVVGDHPEADFYRSRWGDTRKFEDLPSVGRSDLVATPLSRRRYKHEKELIKLVNAPEGTFASAWSFSDSARERFGIVLERPMVYLESPHESIEKSIWCYEQGRVPLIGEQNEAVAAYGAEAYRVDSLITDLPSLQKLRPYLEKRTEPLGAISAYISSLSKGELLPFAQYAKTMRLVLTLPETGAIAEAEFSEEPVFIPHDGVVLEHGEGLLLTKLAYLTTPIIRYRTGIRSRPLAGRNDDGFMLL